MTSVVRRVSDGKMLRLVTLWLKAPVVETDEHGRCRMRAFDFLGYTVGPMIPNPRGDKGAILG